MLDIHPWVRSTSAMAIIAAAFLAASLRDLLFLYATVLGLGAATAILREHLRFVLRFASPLLAALFLVWGLWLRASQVPIPGMSGWEYAGATWLRFICCAGAFQVCFVPLLRSPLHLKGFLTDCRVPTWFAVLTIGAVVYLPEVRRRFLRLVDARRAQGYKLQGFSGLRQAPLLMMPLVTSLLDSSVQRAELWGHRSLLVTPRSSTDCLYVSMSRSLVFGLVGAVSLTFGLASRMGAT